MRIGFIEPHLGVYGGIRRIVELANRLTERGHHVTIYHPAGSECEWMECIAETKSSSDALKQFHDVILYNDPNPVDCDLAKKAEAKLKVFYVLALYDRSLLKGFSPRIYLPSHRRMLLLKRSLASPYLKLANSTWVQCWLKDNMGIHSTILLGGINTEMFRPVEVKRSGTEIRILCSGDPRERKGTQTVLEAVEIARKEEPRIVLDTYFGRNIPQSKMAEVYSSADVFVDGQWYAAWNNPVLEAMACKVPIVCTDIGGVQDFAFHEKTALLVPPKDPKAMASAILWLIRDEPLRETLRENAYKHIQQFDWDKSAQRLEQILGSQLSMTESYAPSTSLRGDILGRFQDNISKVLESACRVARSIVDAGRNVVRVTYRLARGKRQAPVLREETYLIPRQDRFQSKKAQQSICDATDYILGDENFLTCLDAGYGGNQYRQMLLNKCNKVVGIDLNPAPAPDTCKMDALHLAFNDNTFDLVFSNQVIEHIYRRDYSRFFSELLRVCKPKGKILILTPNQFGPTRFFEGNFMTYLDADHKKEFNYLYARRIKKQVEENFDCQMKIYGYSSFDSDHGQLIRLWSWLPMPFRKLAVRFPLLGRGIVFSIVKHGKTGEEKDLLEQETL